MEECTNKTYHQNNFGITRKCNCSDGVHITFGTVSLLLNRSQISDFTEGISKTLLLERTVEDRDDRCIYIPTRDYFLMFALTYNELKQLSDLLENTLLMIEIENALEVN